jgi:hypothetical protein
MTWARPQTSTVPVASGIGLRSSFAIAMDSAPVTRIPFVTLQMAVLSKPSGPTTRLCGPAQQLHSSSKHRIDTVVPSTSVFSAPSPEYR